MKWSRTVARPTVTIMGSDLNDLLKPIDLKEEFKRFGKLMKKTVAGNLARKMWKGAKVVRPLTQAVTGRSTPGGSLIQRMAEMEPRIKKRGVSVGPSRAKKFQTMAFFIKGRSNKITLKQQRFLRALAVKHDFYDERVLFLPVWSKPFALGRTLFQQRRDPFHFASMDLNQPAIDIANRILRTWGFE